MVGSNDKSHENPGTRGTKLKVFRNNLKILYHPIFNYYYDLYQNKSDRVVVPGAFCDVCAGVPEDSRALRVRC